MLKHFYRLMVVILAALTATAATGCNEVATDYGVLIPHDSWAGDADTTTDASLPDDDTLVND